MHPLLDVQSAERRHLRRAGHDARFLYAIVVGQTTLKVPQHVMTLSDFHILWFVLGIAVTLGLEALKKHMQKVPVH